MSVSSLAALLLITGAPTHPANIELAQAVALAAGPQDPNIPARAEMPIGSSLPPIRKTSSTPVDLAPGEAGTEEIIVTARPGAAPGDPLEHINAKSFEVTQAVDNAVIGPVALAYEHSLPKPIRSGLRNFLYNLREPVVFLNFIIQLKPGKGAETFGRFAINSTIGVAGLVDVAKRHPFKLPRRPNGFADSLGFYGVKPGPFFFLPLIGPTTLRDLVGDGVDRFVLPLSVGRPFNRLAYTVPTAVVGTLDRRAEFYEKLRTIRGSPDPYSTRRDLYLQGRQAEIDHLRGHLHCSESPRSKLAAPDSNTAPPSGSAPQC
jgi:phospholipid-binding lipoprotein MlaA